MVKSFKSKNNSKLLLVLGVVVVIGIAVLYYLSIRNQTFNESFSNSYMSTEDVKKLINENDCVLVFHKMEGCGHCVAFKPEWDKYVSTNSNVATAMVDPSNDLSADVQGFPTIRLYKSVDNYVEFEDERTAKALEKFVSSNK
jgi:hypothetical protein